MRTVAVVLAAGSGKRFGGELPKQLQRLAGRTLIEHSVGAFQDAPGVDAILLVVSPDLAGPVGELLGGRYGKVTGIVELGDEECDVLFHDAARPLVDQATIAGCVAALATDRAVGVAIPSSDSIFETRDGVVTAMPRRDALLRCQTPQGFRLSVIRRAYQLADADPGFASSAPTDDCGVVLRYLPDVPVRAVPGSERNLKITYPADLAIAELLLSP
jgi:2-C-methyl-D-erythritol 4-phosphate cytidylyltransferase